MARNFHTMLEEGQDYEKRLIKQFQQRGVLCVSTQDNPGYQKLGIDLIISRVVNGVVESYYGEVKADSQIHKTGNIFIELGMARQTGYRRGWFYTCKADYIFYIDTIQEIVYAIDWSALKRYLESGREQEIKFWNKYDQCFGYGYLIPIQHNKYIVKTEQLK